MAEVLNSLANNWVALIAVLVVLAVTAIGVRKGLFKFQGKGFEIGIEDKERRVMQRQTTYIHTQLEASANELMLKHEDFDRWRTLFITKCLEIELIRRIHFNHIEDTESYRNDTFIQLQAIVRKKASNAYFFSADFDELLKDKIAEWIPYLERIRKEIDR